MLDKSRISLKNYFTVCTIKQVKDHDVEQKAKNITLQVINLDLTKMFKYEYSVSLLIIHYQNIDVTDMCTNYLKLQFELSKSKHLIKQPLSFAQTTPKYEHRPSLPVHVNGFTCTQKFVHVIDSSV